MNEFYFLVTTNKVKQSMSFESSILYDVDLRISIVQLLRKSLKSQAVQKWIDNAKAV